MSEFIIVSNDLAPSIVEVSSPGPQGSSGTVSVGTVTTGASGSAAEVTNSGTPSAAVLNFTIPKGDIGDVTPAATAAKNAAEAAATASAASSTAAQSSATSATASATAAQSSATAASTSAATATTKSQEASTSASNAAASAQSVLTAANTATTKAQESAASAAASLSSANTATTKAQEASASATTADTKAQEAVVSANVATNKAQEASASAVTALSAQQISTENATLAIAQANLATTKAAEASTSATNALSQASTATAQAQEATAQTAVSTAQAVISTTQAGISAAQATISTTQAGISAAQANTSTAQATIATTQATNANTSAVQAASSATAALASQVAAAGSATSANTSAGSASGSAASALAIYGTTAAQQAALTNAQSAASLAQGYALSASSAIQQDLSGVTAQALHRSPNAVTAMFVYDTSKDSDGGAWTEKCQHTSWYNEPLMGKWLGAQTSEFQARNVGAMVSVTELVSNGNFSNGTTGWAAWNTNAQIAVNNGQMTVSQAVGGNQVGVGNSTAYPTVAGRTYQVTLDVVSYVGTTTPQLRIGDFNGSVNTTSISLDAGTGRRTAFFTANTTATYVNVATSGAAGNSVTFDNISVREVTALTTASGDYYQSTTDGKFYKLNKNLLTRSEEFDNASWATQNITVVPNTAAAPNGTMTAELVYPVSSGVIRRFARGTGVNTSAIFTKSVHLKSSGIRWAYMFRGDGGAIAAWFDLQNGVVGTVNSGYTAQISPAGNGWYRCSVTSKDFTVSNFMGYLGISSADNSENVIANGTDGVLFWGAQLEYGALTPYEINVTTATISETFRGNKADFPRLAGIVAEFANVTIYDLTEAGRPMWMRFAGVGNYKYIQSIYRAINVNALSASNAALCVSIGDGLLKVDYAKETAIVFMQTTGGANINGYNINNKPIALRNDDSNKIYIPESPVIRLANNTVNAVAMTVLPDAPVDAVTGLQTPTIAVATGGGVSVIKHNGTVVNSASTGSHSQVGIGTDGSLYAQLASQTYTARNIGSLSTSFAYLSPNLNPQTPPLTYVGNNLTAIRVRGKYNLASSSANGISFNKDNSPQTKGTGAAITNNFNTGHLVGDIRRAYLADTDVGSVSGTELVVNGTFDTDTAGWSSSANYSSTATVVSGAMRVTATGAYGRQVTPIFCTVGKTYLFTISARSVSGNSMSVGVSSTPTGEVEFFELTTGSTSFTKLSRVFTATRTTYYVYAGATSVVGAVNEFDDISVKEIVVDRSYKSATAPITGTLTKTQVAAAAQMVAYSGFSAANYLREPYSADLDFGTGEWSASAWVNVPVTLPDYSTLPTGINLNASGNFTTGTFWSPALTGATVSNGIVSFSGVNQLITTQNLWVVPAGGSYLVTITVDSISAQTTQGVRLDNSTTNTVFIDINGATWITSAGLKTYVISVNAGDSLRVATYSGFQGNAVLSAFSIRQISPFLMADRASSAGTRINVGLTAAGRLTATAFDGTTTRTVTTTAAYNTGTWLKAEADYTTDGTLAISVNGVEVAATRGNPLLSLNSRYNLANFSEQFNSWSKSQVTVTENTATDPLGGNTASKVAENSTSSTAFNVFQTISGADAGVSYQFVLYAKAAERSQVHMQFDNSGAFAGNDRFARFDLSLGTVLTSSNATGVITNEGNGWYKCTISATTSAAGNIAAKVLLSNANTFVYTGVIGNGILLWGADVRRTALAALPYQRTTTVAETIIAPLTIGNSFAANAPFPGSIALLKLSATVPTAEQSVWMYEQEKQMFRESAQVTLPDANAIVDLAYDDATDKWLAVSATNESEFSGLIRTSVTASPAGSYSKISAASGIQLQARTTTNPGVDVTIPPYGLREELVNRSQAAARLARNLVSFDYVGGFTANTTTGSTAITSAANITYPVTYIGARVSATGIPADTFVVAISGTTIYLTKAATATASAVQISFNDFILPVGYEARDVLLAGVSQREGATQAFTRLFDGFKETIRFTTAPSNTALVQIKATRSIQ